jgi:hypothetical protein
MSPGEKVYEMLWDCRFCGTRKNLGKTHRFCPNCGGPQDATARYFPSDAEKVAVQDHQYFGADLACPACAYWNGARSNHCGNCGGPLAGAKEAARRSDQVAARGGGFGGESVADARRELGGAPPGYAAPAAAAPPPARKSSPILWIALGALGLVVAAVLVLVFWKREGALRVAGHTWEREIAIEALADVRESRWCDEMPADASGVSRHRDVRSHRRVADGQDCSTRRVDRGDGTFKEVQDCQPRYKDEPVYDDKCDYTVRRWKVSRTLKAKGTLADARRWPDVALTKTGSCLGCEREGPRTERYVVRFVDAENDDDDDECSFDEAKWQSFADGSAWKGDIGVLTGSLDCDSVRAK